MIEQEEEEEEVKVALGQKTSLSPIFILTIRLQ
jgi:hypothetical protein